MVKVFAKWEVAEQETIADILKLHGDGRKGGGSAEAAVGRRSGKMLDRDGKASLDSLKAASGAEFDKAFVTAQLDGHKKLLTIQEDYLKIGQDREHLSLTKRARGQIKEYIDHLDMLKSKLG